MKTPTRAPFYATMYHGLCDTARKHGYALAIHGTLAADLDLIAVPWVDEAVAPEILIGALLKHIGACHYDELLRQQLSDENLVQQILAREGNFIDTAKPHGRRAWNLYLDHGAKVDVSVMPLAPTASDSLPREQRGAAPDAEWVHAYTNPGA